MSKRRIVLGVCAGLACALLMTVFFLPAEPGVTRGNFRRVQIGMSQTETEAILGAPNPVAPNGRTWSYEG